MKVIVEEEKEVRAGNKSVTYYKGGLNNNASRLDVYDNRIDRVETLYYTDNDE
jgi:hypothetical protein